MSRVRKTLKNAKVSMAFYVLATITAFFTRKIFLTYLGDDFMGLTGTLKSILGFLNIAELGVGTAIGFTLYKPLYNNNRYEINRLVYLIGYLYKRLGALIFIIGILISAFFPFIFGNQSISLGIIYIGFYSYLLAAVIGFFINYSQVVLQADQKGYVIAAVFQSFNITRQIVQALIAYYLKSFTLWLVMEMLFSILNSYFINRQVQKTYPFINDKLDIDSNIFKAYPKVIRKIKEVFVHRISSFVTSGTDQILIYALVSLKSVAFFGNYSMILTQIATLINTLFSGMGAGVGNLVAENNPDKIQAVFWEMMGLRILLTGIFLVNLFFLIDPLIIFWLGEEYILDKLIVNLMMFNLAMQIIRLPIDNYITAYGLYQDTWAPLAQVFINLGISIYFGMKWGIAGIMLGTSVSMFIIIFIWKPHFLYREGFGLKAIIAFWPKFLKLIMSLLLSFVLIYLLITEYITIEGFSLLDLCWSAFKMNLLIIPILLLSLFILNSTFRILIFRIFKLIKK